MERVHKTSALDGGRFVLAPWHFLYRHIDFQIYIKSTNISKRPDVQYPYRRCLESPRKN